MQIEKYCEISKNIEGCADRLSRLSDAFHLMGNDAIACKLRSIADCLQRESEELRDVVFEDIGDRFNQARGTSQNVLNAMIVGVRIAGIKATDETE